MTNQLYEGITFPYGEITVYPVTEVTYPDSIIEITYPDFEEVRVSDPTTGGTRIGPFHPVIRRPDTFSSITINERLARIEELLNKILAQIGE